MYSYQCILLPFHWRAIIPRYQCVFLSWLLKFRNSYWNNSELLLQVCFVCIRVWKPSSQLMNWNWGHSCCRLESWSTGRSVQGWRWMSVCLPSLVPDAPCGRASWPCCPLTSYTKPADAYHGKKARVSVLIRMIFLSLYSVWRDAHLLWCCDLTGQLDKPESESVKQVELRVPRSASLQGVWSFSDFSPFRLLALPARLFGCTSPSLWMLSVCLAEIEKHKGNRFYRKTKLLFSSNNQ